MIIGKIFSGDCIHCKNMQLSWDNLKNKLTKHNVTVIEIEASNNQDEQINQINEKYVTDINKLICNGYPTIFKIVNGKVSYYESERSTEKMYKWIFPLNPRKNKTNRYKKRKGKKHNTNLKKTAKQQNDKIYI
jgi:hypothetical protein